MTDGDNPPVGILLCTGKDQTLVEYALAGMAALGTVVGQGRLHQQDIYMPITPMFHVHAWGFPFVSTLIGAKQVYPGEKMPVIEPFGEPLLRNAGIIRARDPHFKLSVFC